MKFDLNSAIYLNGYWFDNDGNRITDSEYNKLLSASTWSEIDPELLEVDHRADKDFREYVMGINL